jgi:hypothetical protein
MIVVSGEVSVDALQSPRENDLGNGKIRLASTILQWLRSLDETAKWEFRFNVSGSTP